MVRLADSAPVYLELYEALAYFLGRQQLVVRAVMEQGVPLEALRDGVAGWHDKTAQTGDWGHDWHFMFHGGGCELKHRYTGEPIDWNGPDPLAFGTSAFLYHLEWRLTQGHALPWLSALIEREGDSAVRALIEQLIADGVISPDRRLIPGDNLAQASAA
jgi:hypothetical protein